MQNASRLNETRKLAHCSKVDAMAESSEQVTSYEQSYRERDVDERLDDVEHRITRLEKAALIGLGYAIASGADIVVEMTKLI